MLVKRVAEALRPHGIPVMPLKGVLLQRLVYGDKVFRPISDVDILVPEPRFFDAYAILQAAGFSRARWEKGQWEVTLTDPAGPPLGVDLHRTLSRTYRSRLTSAGLFARGTPDSRLFGTQVVLPCGEDLFAHLLFHASLERINLDRLHNPGDFEAVAAALGLTPARCARHLLEQGLVRHALFMLPALRDRERAAGGTFLERLGPAIECGPVDRIAALVVKKLCETFSLGHPARRLAGTALAPSVSRVLASAVRDRIAPESHGSPSV